MGAQRISHVQYHVPGTQVPRPGSPTFGDVGGDLETYARPLEQVHAGTLHGQGVAEGLAVAGAVGSATLTVAPGVAVDTQGRHIVLAPGSVAEIGEAPDVSSRLVAVPTTGVSLLTLPHTGSCALTIAWRETTLPQTFTAQHTPWLRVLPLEQVTEEQVVLASVELDAASGVLQNGISATGRPRVATVTSAVRLSIPGSTTSGQTFSVDESLVAQLGAGADGGVELRGAAPGGTVSVLADGGTLADLSLSVDRVSVRRADGSAPLVLDGATGRVGIGTDHPTQPLHVAASSGLRQNELHLSGDAGWSSLTYNALHDESNQTWVFPDQTRPAVTVEMDDNGGRPRFQVWSTQEGQNEAWAMRFGVDGFSGGVSIPGNLVVGNGANVQGFTSVHTSGPDTMSVTNDTGNALCVTTHDGMAIRAVSNTTVLWAAGASQFIGDVTVTGSIQAASKQFLIDHPLDPENRTLAHASVESSEHAVIYSGNATCDDSGTARVPLPDWVEALAGSFRYQLTCLGAHAPVYVSQEVAQGSFEIAGGTRGLRVSWQLTGVRRDAWARANELVVEQDKPEAERGFYQQPAAFGKTLDASVHRPRNEDVVQRFPNISRRFIRGQAEQEQGRVQAQAARHGPQESNSDVTPPAEQPG